MINLPETVKNQYKDYNREIKAYANLYLADTKQSKNLFNGIGNVGVRIDTSTGNTFASTYYAVSNYIKVMSETNYTFTYEGRYSYYSWYDNTKTYISGGILDSNTSTTTTSPENAEYIRFDFLISCVEEVQMEQGTEATEYEDYNKITSKNIFNSYATPTTLYLTTIDVLKTGTIKVNCDSPTVQPNNYALYYINPSDVLGRNIYFSMRYESTSKYPQVYLFGMKNNVIKSSITGQYVNYSLSGKMEFSYLFPDFLPNDYDSYAIGFYARRAVRQDDAQIDDYTIYKDIMIGTQSSYEEYGQIIKNYNVDWANFISKNLFDFNETPISTNYARKIDNDNSITIISLAAQNWANVVMPLDKSKLLGKKIYFKSNYVTSSKMSAIFLTTRNNTSVVLAGPHQETNFNGSFKFNYTFPETTSEEYCLIFFANTSGTATTGDNVTYSNIMVSENEDDEYDPYYKPTPLSNNLLNQENYYSLINCEYTNGMFNQITIDTATSPSIRLQAYNNGVYVSDLGEKNFYNESDVIYFQFTKTSQFNQVNYKVNGIQINTGVIFDISHLDNGKTYYIGATFLIKKPLISLSEIGGLYEPDGYIKWTDMYINEDNGPYERYNTKPFKLTSENNCKILSFNINQKTDPYYTSTPYNTMTIEVDNEKGYFTITDEDNILNYLNKDSYVDLFININDGPYYKIMTMNFDKLSFNDYKTAKLSFYSSLANMNDAIIKDKNLQLNNLVNYYPVQSYLYDNYNLNLLSDHSYFDSNRIVISKFKDLKTIITCVASRAGYDGTETYLTTNYNNIIFLKKISNDVEETISSNLQLEKPIIKNDNIYKNIKYNYYRYNNETPYEGSPMTYSKNFQYTLKAKREVIIIVENDYEISGITMSDVTVTGNVTVTKNETQTPYQNYLSFTIEGNIGEEYTIAINKENVNKFNAGDLLTDTRRTNPNNEEKTLILNPDATNWMVGRQYYFLFMKKPLLYKIEAKIMGLPYLEVGDTIQLNFENKNEKISITEINTNYGDGLIQTIKGNRYDWTHKATASFVNDLDNWTD